MNRNINYILKNAISPYDYYCSGASLGLGKGYIAAPSLSAAHVKIGYSHAGSQLLDEIIAYDKAEAAEADLTQTNMITVSSFVGVNGAILGYDLLKQPLQSHPLFPDNDLIYTIKPLCEATKSLFGTVNNKRFSIAPGEHLPCAYKSLKQRGPTFIYGSLAVAIAEDRSKNADLFMEDLGTVSDNSDRTQKKLLYNLLKSVEAVSNNTGVKYSKVFMDNIIIEVSQDEIGCMLVAAPYINIPKAAAPYKHIEDLAEVSLKEWEQNITSNSEKEKNLFKNIFSK